MDIAQYFADNHHHLYFLIAGIAFVIELTVMGLSGPLFFFALGAFFTGIFSSLGFVSTWEMEIFVLGILTAFIAAVLWKPLNHFQKKGTGIDNSSDMIGLEVPSSSIIDAAKGSIRFSGIDWTARLDPNAGVSNIPESSMCQITAMKGNVAIVKPL